MLRHLPNLITGLRILLVWPVYWLTLTSEFKLALLLAAIAGMSDAVDGFLAKHFGWQSRLGGMLDPLADKLLLLACFLALTVIGELPGWFFVLVIARDVLIVCGAVAYHNLIGAFDAQPSLISKLTTAVQILFVLEELLRLAWLPQLPGHAFLLVLSAALTLGSGLHYVLVWSLRARRALHERKFR